MMASLPAAAATAAARRLGAHAAAASARHGTVTTRRGGALQLRRRPRPFSSTSTTTTGTGAPPPTPASGATTAAAGVGEAAPAAEGAGSSGWGWKLKAAAWVLGPLSLPVGFVAAVVYDPEFREDVDRRFPEIVEYIRRQVGFEEDLERRRRDLEKEYISSQPVRVTAQLQSGARYSETVSPLRTLSELYDALVNGGGGSSGSTSSGGGVDQGPMVELDFEDIPDEPIEDPSIRDPLEAPHPNDALAVVPPPLRNVVGSSLWDVLGAGVTGGGSDGSLAGDTIAMKQQMAKKDQRQVAIEALEASLRDIDEEIGILQHALKTGNIPRAIDDVENDIRYLKHRRAEVKRELRANGKWWRW